MDSLKMIDELLCLLKQRDGLSWETMEEKGFLICRDAIAKLRQAWKDGEMDRITLSLAEYFKKVPK